MQRISGQRPLAQVDGASAISDSQPASSDAEADLLLVLGPDTSDRWLKITLEAATRKGLVVHTIGDGTRDISLEEIIYYRASHDLLSTAQVLISMHGFMDNGEHLLESGRAVQDAISATDLLHVLRGDLKDTDGYQLINEWHGITHFFSCESGKFRDTLAADEALWSGGLVVMHASGRALLQESSIPNTNTVIDYAGDCKRNHLPVDPFVLAAQLQEVAGDSFTIAGSELQASLIVRAPQSADETLPNQPVSGRQKIEGTASDLDKLAAAKKNLAPSDAEQITNKRVNTLLTRIHRGEIDQVKNLLDAFPGLGTEPKHQVSPVAVAAHTGRVDILQLLLQRKYPLDTRDEYQQTPLAVACVKGDLATVRMLVSYGADTRCVDDLGETILHKAVLSAELELIDYLQSFFVLDGQADPQGVTPLHLAITKSNLQVVERLLSSPGALTAVDHQGRTVLHYALLHADPEIVSLLLNASSDVINQADAEGNTPLHYAVERGDVDLVQLLSQAGANRLKKNHAGERPSSFARGKDNAALLIAELNRAQRNKWQR